MLFKSIINNITEFMKSTDLIRMSVQCPEFDFPITIPFIKVSQLSVDTLLHEIERVLQSHEQFVLDESLEIEMTHVELPSGGTGRKCKFVDLDRFLKEKKCIIRIKKHDDICCAGALVTGLDKANHEKHEQWDNMRRGFKIQEQPAAELHILAKVPHRKCEIEKNKQFQTVMPEYQINFVSKEHFNGIIYKGAETEKKYTCIFTMVIMMSLPVYRLFGAGVIIVTLVKRDINIKRNTVAITFVHHATKYTRKQKKIGYTVTIVIVISMGPLLQSSHTGNQKRPLYMQFILSV
ncbi:unnamed protein product [Mytilus coruscus]|uniref:Uncharacterized protein n=1 Tax=Mytilus coruscus TaxID=42192 RepID=A0A6J8BNT7_MYTCO|nr:unnamed protein product [Mytilus coruscus]